MHCSRNERSQRNPKCCHTSGRRLDQTSGWDGEPGKNREVEKGQGINKKGQIFTMHWCQMIPVMSKSVRTEVSFTYRSGAHSCQHSNLHLSMMVAKGDKLSSKLPSFGSAQMWVWGKSLSSDSHKLKWDSKPLLPWRISQTLCLEKLPSTWGNIAPTHRIWQVVKEGFRGLPKSRGSLWGWPIGAGVTEECQRFF